MGEFVEINPNWREDYLRRIGMVVPQALDSIGPDLLKKHAIIEMTPITAEEGEQ